MEYLIHGSTHTNYLISSVIVFCCLIGHILSTSMMHTVLWATDDKFFFNKTSPTLTVQMDDSVDFVCPQLIHTNYEEPDHIKYMHDFTLYKVNSEDFDSCNVTKAARFIFRCNTPAKRRRYTFHVVKFTAIPGGLEFQCDQQYYFIAAENPGGRGINGSAMCGRYNTKLQLNVRCDQPHTESTHSVGTHDSMSGTKKPHEETKKMGIIIGVCVSVGVIFIVVVIILVILYQRRRKSARQDAEDSTSWARVDVVKSPNSATLQLAVVDITKVRGEETDDDMYWAGTESETNERAVE